MEPPCCQGCSVELLWPHETVWCLVCRAAPARRQLPRELLEARVTFGLEAGKRAQVAAMLADGATWQAIGRAMGWDPATLQQFYEKEP